jgi:hypothetical protein
MASMLSGFFRRLTGSGGGDGAAQARGPAVEYNGFAIHAAPRREGSQWLTAGVIAKEFPEGVREHHFIRAETHPSQDEAQAFAVLKAKQIIDELGDRLFKDREPPAPSG